MEDASFVMKLNEVLTFEFLETESYRLLSGES